MDIPFRSLAHRQGMSDSMVAPGVQVSRAAGGNLVVVAAAEVSTAGWDIEIRRITRDGTELRVHAELRPPGEEMFTAQVISYVAHEVAIAELDFDRVELVLVSDG